MNPSTRLLLAAAATLALTGCAGGEPTSVQARAAGPIRRYGDPTVEFSIFQWRVPANALAVDTTPEYGTRFKTSLPGRVIGFRVYHFAGDTNRVTFTLRSSAGGSLRTATLSWDPTVSPDSSRWRDLYLSTVNVNTYALTPGVWYRVSARTHGTLGKTTGLFAGGPIVNHMLTADQGFTLTGSTITTTTSDAYFVDVIFQPDPV